MSRSSFQKLIKFNAINLTVASRIIFTRYLSIADLPSSRRLRPRGAVQVGPDDSFVLEDVYEKHRV